MANLITILVVIAAGYWIMMIVSRKKQELADKELRQKEQFLKESQSILKTEAPSFSTPIQTETIQPTSDNNYSEKVSQYFSTQGYIITDGIKTDGIALIGVKERELLLIQCESTLKEIKKIDLKIFIADCTVYIDNNPMLTGRSIVRVYATNRPITDEAQEYVRNNSSSLRFLEDIQ
jgi:hypothetical protein